MKELIKNLRRKILYSYRSDALSYAKRLNRLGAKIDTSISMAVPESVRLDETTPYMMEIGKNVYIAENVSILTHDASWLVLKGEDGEIRGHIGPVKIGNNVFIGINSTILCNVSICDNVIIGAHSVVGTSIKRPGVYAGNPAKFIMSLDDMKSIREGRQIREAYTIVRKYYDRFQKKPSKEILDEYFWVFEKRNKHDILHNFQKQMELCGNLEFSIQKFMDTQPDFEGYDEFWQWCEMRLKKEQKGV